MVATRAHKRQTEIKRKGGKQKKNSSQYTTLDAEDEHRFPTTKTILQLYMRCSYVTQRSVKQRLNVEGMLNVSEHRKLCCLQSAYFDWCNSTHQLQASVSLRRCTAAALYTSNMAALIIVDEMTRLSSHV